MDNIKEIKCHGCGANLLQYNSYTVSRIHVEAENYIYNANTNTLEIGSCHTIEQGNLFCIVCDTDVSDLLESIEIE